jgi:hypothetical protein
MHRACVCVHARVCLWVSTGLCVCVCMSVSLSLCMGRCASVCLPPLPTPAGQIVLLTRACVGAPLTYARTVALTNLTLSQRDQAFTRVDELLAEYSRYTDRNAKQNTEVMAGVLQVFSKMDSLI